MLLLLLNTHCERLQATLIYTTSKGGLGLNPASVALVSSDLRKNCSTLVASKFITIINSNIGIRMCLRIVKNIELIHVTRVSY